MDVVALGQYDIDYAVAALGTATTSDHIHTLFRTTVGSFAATTATTLVGKRLGGRWTTHSPICRMGVNSSSCFAGW